MVAYLRLNCEPVQRMRDMLHQYFSASAVEKDFSLAISTGRAGARLTHNHARQFQFGNPPTPRPLVGCAYDSGSIIDVVVDYYA